MHSKPNIDPDRYVDNECNPEQAARFQEAMANDPALAAQVERLESVNQQLREHRPTTLAPETLHESLAQLTGEPDALIPTRRRWLIAGGAALAAGVAGVTSIRLHRQSVIDTQTHIVTDTFFKDFETYLVKNRTLDIQERNLVRIAQWYKPRLPFQLPPISSSGAGASLIGGRLCWLLERRLASLSFDTPKGPVVLYISQADGLDMPEGGKSEKFGRNVTWHRSRSNTSLIWTRDGLLMAMVSTQEISSLKRIARSIIS